MNFSGAFLALLVSSPGIAQATDMLNDASNATLQTARDNIVANRPVAPDPGTLSWRTPVDFSAKCDVQVFSGGASWSAGGATFTPDNGITPVSGDSTKTLVVYGAGSGGSTYVGAITGVSGGAWTVSPALTQKSGLNYVYAAKVQTAASGGSYVPGDVLTVSGGNTTGGSSATLTIKYTTVVSATVTAGGSGGTPGTQTVSGTTGKGQYFQASVTVSGGGAITGVNLPISVGGAYSTNPTTLGNEPVAGANLSGAALALTMGVAQVLVTRPGGYIALPPDPSNVTGGSGSGAKFTLTFDNAGVPGQYGQWYYGTDDKTALNNAVGWAATNEGTVRLPPGAKCGTSETLTMNGNFATLIGEGSGVSEGNRFPMAVNSALYWMGSSGSPLINIKTPTCTVGCRVLGNSVKKLALIGGNLAGYGLQIGTAAFGDFEDLYLEQFGLAAIYLTTNDTDPNGTQFLHFSNSYLNQEGANGKLLLLAGNTDVNGGPIHPTEDASSNTFDKIFGWQGNDTALVSLLADSNTFNTVGWLKPDFSGALYGTDLGCTIGSASVCTGQNRFTDFRGGQVIARGTSSSGTAAVSLYSSIEFGGDTAPPPIVEPGAQLDVKTTYLEHNILLTNKLIAGWPIGGSLYNARSYLDNSNSAIYSAGDLSFATLAGGIQSNLKFDLTKGSEYLSTGVGYFLGPTGTNFLTYSLLSAPSGMAGTPATLTTIWSATASGGLQIGTPTGGDKGVGTLNLATLYDAGTAPTGTAGSGYVRATSPMLTSATLTDAIDKGFVVSTTELDKTNDVSLANITGLSIALTAGKTYNCFGHLSVSTGASAGAKFALTGSGGLTATSVSYTGTVGGSSITATALGAALGNTSALTDILINGAIAVSAGGTVTVQGAQNVATGATTKFLINSTFACKRVN